MLCLRNSCQYIGKRSFDSNAEQHTLIPDLIHQVHHYVNLVHGRSVEVLPHSQRELLFRHPPLILPPRHGRTLLANTRICEEGLIER